MTVCHLSPPPALQPKNAAKGGKSNDSVASRVGASHMPLAEQSSASSRSVVPSAVAILQHNLQFTCLCLILRD